MNYLLKNTKTNKYLTFWSVLDNLGNEHRIINILKHLLNSFNFSQNKIQIFLEVHRKRTILKGE